MERLQKYLAHGGIASRRQAEQIILDGRVSVNGQVVKELGVKVDPVADVVTVDGKVMGDREELVYYLLHKPSGYVTTVTDQFNRPKVLDLLPRVKSRIYPVGRLDYETEGLLLLTNDGQLAFYLTQPKHKVDKVYQVLVEGKITKQQFSQLNKGVKLEDGLTAPAKTRLLKKWPHQNLVELTIHEGKNRQVRRMMEAVGLKVKYLRRTKMGNLELGTLPVGKYRQLTKGEVAQLKKTR